MTSKIQRKSPKSTQTQVSDELKFNELEYQADLKAELTCASFHPDGRLLAAGAKDGQVKVFDVTTGKNAANFDENGPIQDLAFSENGIWLAVAVEGSTSISIWDLRKASKIKVIENGNQIEKILWDHSGQFLAVAGSNGIAVHQYSKATKEWSVPLQSAVSTVAVEWGAQAQSLISLDLAGVITVLKAA